MKKRRERFKNFSDRCTKDRGLNLNPLLSVIINLVPLFLIVLNLRAIVGVEQNHMPPAKYDASIQKESKELINVNVELYRTKTKISLLNYKGDVLSKKTFGNISENKQQIIDFLSHKTNLGNLTINPLSASLTFDEISHAIDLSNYKINDKRLFKNFSVENIL